VNTTYIIRFADESARAQFSRVLQTQSELAHKRIEFGEFLPDMIVYDISDAELQKLRRLAGTQTRFFADFQHELFQPH